MKTFVWGMLLVLAGVPGVSALDSPRPTLLLVNDQPWLAWSERRGDVTVGRVAQWDGKKWNDVGGVLNRQNDQSVASIALALGPDGSVWAAWGEKPPKLVGKNIGSGLLHVAFWTGADWIEPGRSPSRSSRTVSERPLLQIDSRRRPWVSWSEITPDFNVDNVYLAYFDRKWTVVDNGTLTTDVSSAGRSRDLVLLPGDKPLLALSWMIYQHDFQVFVGPWDGKHWSRWGGKVNSGDRWAGFPSMKLDSKGRPVVAYLQAGDGGFGLEVRRWSGSAWDDLGFPAFKGERSPQLVVVNDQPVVASVEPKAGLVVRRLQGSWISLGSVSTPGAFVDTLTLAADSQGRPWVTWAEDDAKGQRLGLARWDGAKWEKKATPEYRPR